MSPPGGLPPASARESWVDDLDDSTDGITTWLHCSKDWHGERGSAAAAGEEARHRDAGCPRPDRRGRPDRRSEIEAAVQAGRLSVAERGSQLLGYVVVLDGFLGCRFVELLYVGAQFRRDVHRPAAGLGAVRTTQGTDRVPRKQVPRLLPLTLTASARAAGTPACRLSGCGQCRTRAAPGYTVGVHLSPRSGRNVLAGESAVFIALAAPVQLFASMFLHCRVTTESNETATAFAPELSNDGE